MPHSRSTKTTVVRLILPSLVMAGLFVAMIFFLFLPLAKKHAVERRKESLKDLSLVARSVLTYYHRKEKQGEISSDKAKELAANILRNLRYGKDQKQYFWVIDLAGVTIVHPYRRDHEGVSHIDMKDSDGKFFIKDFIETATKEHSGFVEYKWQIADKKSDIRTKIAHVRLFQPWGWIVGSGLYIDDIDLDMAYFTWLTVLALLIIGGGTAVVYFYVLKDILSMEDRNRSSFEKLLSRQSKIRALLDAVPDMILRIDREGTVLDVKDPVSWKPFIDPIDILDKKIIDTWDAKTAEKVIALIERVFVTREPQELIFDYPVSGGKKVKIESHYVLSGGDEILATFRDISGRSE